MNREEPRAADRISAALVESGVEPAVASEIGFHMTDWYSDLVELHRLLDNVDQISGQEISSTVIRFLAHVPNHVAAAKKLVGLGPIEDVFGVGVLQEDDP